MPVEKDLKRLVRERMKKTGESYTTARQRVRPKRPGRGKPPEATAPLAGRAGMSDAAVTKGTGHDWKHWVSALDRLGAKAMSHSEIAKLLRSEYQVSAWWSQMVTVGYERIHGLREKGQLRSGTFTVNKSKVYPVPLADLWAAFNRLETWIGNGKLRTTKATHQRSMRMRWSDDASVDVHFYAKTAARSQVQIQHDGHATREDAARLRAWWTERLAALGLVLAKGVGAPWAPGRRR